MSQRTDAVEDGVGRYVHPAGPRELHEAVDFAVWLLRDRAKALRREAETTRVRSEYLHGAMRCERRADVLRVLLGTRTPTDSDTPEVEHG